MDRSGVKKELVRVSALAGPLLGLALIAGAAVRSDSAARLHPSFSPELVLNSRQPQGRISNMYGTSGVESNPAIASGAAGVLIAVWHSSDNRRGEIGNDWDIFYARSTDGGKSWSKEAILNSNAASDAGADLSPVIASDGKGTWIAAWTSTEPFGKSYGRDRDILFARSEDEGLTWSAPTPLNVNASEDYGNDWSVRLANDGNGHWVATWCSTDSLSNRLGGDSDLFVARSRDNGATWTHPIPLNTNAASDAASDGTPDVDTDRKGRWIVVWSSGDPLGGRLGTERDILFSISEDVGATWSDPAPVNRNAASDDNNDWTPNLATNGKGIWVVVWTSADTLGGSIGFDRDLLVARSSDNGDTWSRPAPVDPRAERDAQEDSSPSIVTDGDGNWMAVWHSWSVFSEYGQADADVVVTFSQDDGLSWSSPEPINAAAESDAVDDTLPQLATDGQGNWVAVWQTFAISGGRKPLNDPATSAWTVLAAHGRLVDSPSPAPSSAGETPSAARGGDE